MVATAALQSIGRRVLDALLPPRCLGCGTLVEEPGALCAACWDKAAFIAPPQCARCGLPFELAPAEPAPAEGAECAACVADPPRFDRARAVMRYDGVARGLVLRFKHADATHGAPGFARWMARAGAGLLADCDLIAPVPLHRWRLLWRRYNQSAELGRRIAAQVGKTFIPDLLSRRRHAGLHGDTSRSQLCLGDCNVHDCRSLHIR